MQKLRLNFTADKPFFPYFHPAKQNTGKSVYVGIERFVVNKV